MAIFDFASLNGGTPFSYVLIKTCLELVSVSLISKTVENSSILDLPFSLFVTGMVQYLLK